MVIMEGSMVAGRQKAERLQPDPQAVGRKRETGLRMWVLNPKANLQWATPPNPPQTVLLTGDQGFKHRSL